MKPLDFSGIACCECDGCPDLNINTAIVFYNDGTAQITDNTAYTTTNTRTRFYVELRDDSGNHVEASVDDSSTHSLVISTASLNSDEKLTVNVIIRTDGNCDYEISKIYKCGFEDKQVDPPPPPPTVKIGLIDNSGVTTTATDYTEYQISVGGNIVTPWTAGTLPNPITSLPNDAETIVVEVRNAAGNVSQDTWIRPDSGIVIEKAMWVKEAYDLYGGLCHYGKVPVTVTVNAFDNLSESPSALPLLANFLVYDIAGTLLGTINGVPLNGITATGQTATVYLDLYGAGLPNNTEFYLECLVSDNIGSEITPSSDKCPLTLLPYGYGRNGGYNISKKIYSVEINLLNGFQVSTTAPVIGTFELKDDAGVVVLSGNLNNSLAGLSGNFPIEIDLSSITLKAKIQYKVTILLATESYSFSTAAVTEQLITEVIFGTDGAAVPVSSGTIQINSFAQSPSNNQLEIDYTGTYNGNPLVGKFFDYDTNGITDDTTGNYTTPILNVGGVYKGTIICEDPSQIDDSFVAPNGFNAYAFYKQIIYGIMPV